MNKMQFVKAVAAESGETAVVTARTLGALMNVIAVCMEHDEKIVLQGWGTFYTQERPARTGRNPRTGVMLEIAARKIVKFRPGSRLQLGRCPASKDSSKK